MALHQKIYLVLLAGVRRNSVLYLPVCPFVMCVVQCSYTVCVIAHEPVWIEVKHHVKGVVSPLFFMFCVWNLAC